MERLFYAFFVVILSHNFYCQNYIPFPNTFAIWTISHYGQTGGGPMKFGMFGDTVINTIHYKKIYQSFDHNFNTGNAFYVGAMREINRRVLCVYNGHTTESRMYDFNLNAGDTARIEGYFLGSLSKLKVDSVDYVVINGQNRKRLKFNAQSMHDNEYWIEGIGSTFGVFLPLWAASDNCYTLLCLSKDCTLVYHPQIPANPPCPVIPNYDCDTYLATSLSENQAYNRHTILYPNPFAEITHLKTSIACKQATLIIYDTVGKEVMRYENLSGNDIPIYKNDLNTGVYFYRLSEQAVSIGVGKLVIE